MKYQKIMLAITLALPWLALSAQQKRIEAVDFSKVKVTDGFWGPRLERHVAVTQPVCIDQIAHQTGRIQNFVNAARREGKHSGIFFDDSDVYKAMEGMAYSLVNHPDKQLEARLDEWIAHMEKAQLEDGYLNTYYTLTDLNQRWTDMDKHEMYCAGHLLEAAIAYYLATGKDRLLNVARRMVEHMMNQFGPGKRHWVPGHEEIELALVKLYELTREEKYLTFAHWLLEERGHGHGRKAKGGWKGVYYQDEVPVKDLRSISGHAVRLMYLFCGMADVAAYRSQTGYLEALDELWHDVADRNMYITGGIGQSASNEGFTQDYSLPNATAYCETCASIGMVLWNYRMNQFTGDAKYMDVLERSMYNGILAGINLQGDRFFYVNPLESAGNHHRKAWYGCACCPSNLTRFLPSIGNYIYGISDEALWVNLYIGNETMIPEGRNEVPVSLQTRYPWDGKVTLTMGQKMKRRQLRLRIPAWCKEYKLSVNGKPVTAVTDKGYAVIERKWKRQDRVELSLAMPVEMVAADVRVKEDAGMRAVQRGPLIYCAEEIDNGTVFSSFVLNEKTMFSTDAGPSAHPLSDPITWILARGGGQVLRLLPYYAWDNREACPMKVWIRYDE